VAIFIPPALFFSLCFCRTALYVPCLIFSRFASTDSVTFHPSGQTTTITLAAIDTLDFSMPSYSQATGRGDDNTATTSPSFNPFGDFVPDFKTAPKVDVVEDTIETTDAATTSQSSSREEKKAAAEAAKAERLAALEAKKVEKAARVAIEREKNRLASERMRESAAPSQAVVDETSSFKLPDFSAPEMPSFTMPKVDLPKFDSMPSFSMPKVDMPSAPDLSKLDMPKFDVPKLDIPKFDMPKFDMPANMPKFEMPANMPKFDIPAMPSVPEGASLNIPKFDIPKVAMPSFSLPSFGGDSDSPILAGSQDERDEAARQARKGYLEADGRAKEAEEAARQVRNVSDGLKRLANEAKDLACETRTGGKWICLRNPFTSGF
jgi:hypothetical protein